MNTKEKRELYSLFEEKAAGLVVLLKSHDTGLNVSDDDMRAAGYADFIDSVISEYQLTWQKKLAELISIEEKQFGNLIKSWTTMSGGKR
jgi:hypothetical protein